MIKWIALLFSGMILSATTHSDEILAQLQKQSTKENKLIMVHFTGSDWCASCKVFQQEVMSTEQVKAEVQSNFIYYKSDYTLRKKMTAEEQKRHDFLMEKLNYEGTYPLIVICDKDFNPLKSIQRTKLPQEFLEFVKPYYPAK
ncbi:thioredoxin family protein [Fluviicola sp.]|uniref:thioredoxin family protein n=1 Tax=Fluviicola sp. TaxID=1917219 RepID=UPI0031D2AAE9